MLLSSDLGASRFERKLGTQVNASRTSFTGWSDNPTNAVRENGTVGDEGKAARRRGALAALLFVQRYSEFKLGYNF